MLMGNGVAGIGIGAGIGGGYQCKRQQQEGQSPPGEPPSLPLLGIWPCCSIQDGTHSLNPLTAQPESGGNAGQTGQTNFALCSNQVGQNVQFFATAFAHCIDLMA